MRWIPLAVVMLSLSTPAFAQEWTRFVNTEDGFSANFPGQPRVDVLTYATEYGQTLPARVYRARTRWTLFDDCRRLPGPREAACGPGRQRAARRMAPINRTAISARTISASTSRRHRPCRVELHEARRREDHALHVLLHRAGLRPPDSDDQRRSIADLRGDSSARRPPIHTRSDCPRWNARADSLHGVTGHGRTRRGSRSAIESIYTEGYGEWMFPRERPPFTLRDLTTSIDGVVPRK
jgi:hypothetical protein